MKIQELIIAGARSLGPNEVWVVCHPDGPLWDTASADLTMPVRIVCEALRMDWGDLTEQGFHLDKLMKP